MTLALLRTGVLLAVGLPLAAGVDGTVINRTTGKPQAGATVTIYKLGEAGMESVETVKSDAAGRYSLSYTPAGGPHLIQTAYDGVTYNKMLPPGAPLTNVELEVFEAQAQPGAAAVSQHMILLEAADGKLLVSENIIYQNQGKVTYNDPDGGTLKFYVPEQVQGKVRVQATAPNGMPVERAAVPTKVPAVWTVDFPVKPGETRFQISYELPLPAPPVFKGKILHQGLTRLVAPRGVTLKGAALEDLGREPQTQAAIYNVKAREFEVLIEGTGSLRLPEPGEDEAPSIQQIKPRVYDRLPVVLGLTAAILALGFVLLYRSHA